MRTPTLFKSALLLASTVLIPTAFAADQMIAKLQGLVGPDEALDLLAEGNQRFISGDLLNPDQTPAVRQSLINGQAPFATIVGCSDSRVPPEVIFDRGLGDLFTTRTAGAVVDEVQLDSIEYSVNHVKSHLILVLGHENCGAVDGVIHKSSLKAGDIEYLIPYIQPAVDEARKMPGNLLVNATKLHTQNTIDFLKASPHLAPDLKSGKLKIVGGYYSMQTGMVEILPEE